MQSEQCQQNHLGFTLQFLGKTPQCLALYSVLCTVGVNLHSTEKKKKKKKKTLHASTPPP